jgi:hypothetical protein
LATAGLDAQVVFPRPILTEIHARTSGLFPLIDAVCSQLLRACSLRSTRGATRELLDQACMGLGLPSGSHDT